MAATVSMQSIILGISSVAYGVGKNRVNQISVPAVTYAQAIYIDLLI